MVQIRTNNTRKFGQTNHIHPVGDVQISEEGIVEVESMEIAEEVCKHYKDFSIVGEGEEEFINNNLDDEDLDLEEDLHHKIEEDHLHKTEEDELNADKEEDTLEGKAEDHSEDRKEEEKEEVADEEKDQDKEEEKSEEKTDDKKEEVDEKAALLQSLEGQTLPELKKLAKPFPKDEWKDKNKAELVEYLKAKLA